MSLPVSSQQDLYNLFITVLQDYAPDLTDTSAGSIIDSEGGVFSVSATELTRLIVDQFKKTFISMANGPEITNGPDDLQTLLVDRYGSTFARPQAVQAIDTITFARPTNTKGAVAILAGTVVKTQPDANGNVQRYTTDSTVNLTFGGGTDLSVSVPITAVVAGKAGSASAGTINAIETSLLDPTITCTNAGNATGSDALDDATYRELAYNLLLTLRGATRAAIKAAALAVTGVVSAEAVETEKTVIEYDTATNDIKIGATYFRIPYVTLYIADATGTASPSLIAQVSAALDPIRAYGVLITVSAAVPVTINWTASTTLNPAGPNYATLVVDDTLIENSMMDYLNTLPAATSFVRATANAAILAIWGPAGSNDLTAFTTTLPSGDVAISATQKAIPGVVQTV